MWVTRTIDVPAGRAWELLVDVDRWPGWGPSVAAVELDGSGSGRRIRAGTTGRVRATVGPWVPFRITAFDEQDDGAGQWAWRVLGVPATGHQVEALGPERCRVGFAVPVWAAPYAVVCTLALRRIDGLLTGT